MRVRNIDYQHDPVALLPTQLRRSDPANWSPEVRLVWAILDDAVRSVVHRRELRDRRERREFLEACAWLLDDCCDWPFAFANVCDVLGLDTFAVREALSVHDLWLRELEHGDLKIGHSSGCCGSHQEVSVRQQRSSFVC